GRDHDRGGPEDGGKERLQDPQRQREQRAQEQHGQHVTREVARRGRHFSRPSFFIWSTTLPSRSWMNLVASLGFVVLLCPAHTSLFWARLYTSVSTRRTVSLRTAPGSKAAPQPKPQ